MGLISKAKSMILPGKSAPAPGLSPLTGFDSNSLALGVNLSQKVATANLWRDQLNPLRTLNMPRAVAYLEAAQRGMNADLQWAFRMIERRDADMLALIERRLSALEELNVSVKIMSEKVATDRGMKIDKALAEDQAAALREAYNRIENLYEAMAWMSMAVFRGYAHAQFVLDDQVALPGSANKIVPIPQWNWVRAGTQGDWYFNERAVQVLYNYLGDEQRIDPRYFLIREWERPIDEIGIIKFLRMSLSQKDWDGFIEIYGIPGWIIIMPESVPEDKESEYRAAAENIAKGGSGALPHSSDAKAADSPRGVAPFRDHLQYITEKLILAGTGGMLTMLAAPGSGTLAGGAHKETFDKIARAEARRISEIFQRQFDRQILDAVFAGKPRFAYFDICAAEEQDVGAVCTQILQLNQAGFKVDPDQVTETTGYRVTVGTPDVLKPEIVRPNGGVQNRAIRNRGTGLAFSPPAAAFFSAVAADLAPLRARIAAALELPDAQIIPALEKLRSDLPDLLKQIGADPAAAAQMAEDLQAALDAGKTRRLGATSPDIGGKGHKPGNPAFAQKPLWLALLAVPGCPHTRRGNYPPLQRRQRPLQMT